MKVSKYDSIHLISAFVGRKKIICPRPLTFLFFLILTAFLHSCTEEIVLPTVTTSIPLEITRNTATAGGQIPDDGGSPILGRGVCWGTTRFPDFTRNFTADGEGSGTFSSHLTGMIPNTVYYLRAYATNSIGTAFGNELSFTTAPVVFSTLTTIPPSSIDRTTAISGGDISLDGGGDITQRGVCWSLSPAPEITDYLTNNGSGTGKFVSNISGLSPGTKYYIRAYAINTAGVAYGDEYNFNTKIADIQGNLYNTVTIGTQVWMAENLRTTKFNNNTNIPNITTPAGWINLTGPGYCWYNNDISYKPTFGALYSWYTINTGRLCPTGWHVPTDAEFDTLEITLGMNPDIVNLQEWRGTDQGKQMKSTTGWENNGNGTNSSGFNGLAGGYLQGSSGNSYAIGVLTYWWTSTQVYVDYAWYRRLDAPNNDVYRYYTLKKGGKYVRCVKN